MLTAIILSLMAIAIPFVLYPLLLWLRAQLAPVPVRSAPITPNVDLVICAYNEADFITRKLKNVLALEYPPEKLTIWLASDGSTDGTVAKAKAVADPRIRILDLPRAGKAVTLNTAVAAGSAPVIAFSDANSEWTPGSLRALVAPLNDPLVGGVAGDQRYQKVRPERTSEDLSGERGFWSYDRLLKRWQALAGSATSATGAIYCVRRSLFEPAPPDATDDFMISTGVIAAGYRLAFTEKARAFEPPATSSGIEFHRKVRVISRGLRSVYYRRDLLNPRRTGSYALQLLLHKLWRRLVWIPLVVLCLLAPSAIARGGIAMLIEVALIISVILGLSGLAVPGLKRWKLFSIPSYVLVVNAACILAFYNLFRGNRITQWHLPREQSGEPESSLRKGM